MGKQSVSIQINLPTEAANVLREVCQQKERSQTKVVARLVKWFARQKPPVQTAILEYVDEGMELQYAEALEDLAKLLRHPPAAPDESGETVAAIKDAQVANAETHPQRRKRH